MRNQVAVGDRVYRVMTSPDKLTKKSGLPCRAFIAHTDGVIWIDPRVSDHERPDVLERAVARAAEELSFLNKEAGDA